MYVEANAYFAVVLFGYTPAHFNLYGQAFFTCCKERRKTKRQR